MILGVFPLLDLFRGEDQEVHRDKIIKQELRQPGHGGAAAALGVKRPVFDHQKIKIGIRAGIAASMRAKEDDLPARWRQSSL